MTLQRLSTAASAAAAAVAHAVDDLKYDGRDHAYGPSCQLRYKAAS